MLVVSEPLVYYDVFVCSSNGTVKFLTKGDNNNVDDRGLYAQGQLWLHAKDVVGRARGFLPYVGMVTIYMNEYPKFKVRHTLFLPLYAVQLLSHSNLVKQY